MAPETSLELSPSLTFAETSPKDQPFRIFIPGFPGGGGKDITGIRELLKNQFGNDVFVVSSIGSKHAHKKDEITISQHYEHLAQTVLEKSQGKNIHIVGHSLGGHEALLLLDKVLHAPKERLPKDIKITFMGTPGFTQEKLKGLMIFGKNALQLLNQAPLEQHIAYPLPNMYYHNHPPVQVAGIEKKLFTDSDDKRMQRRDRFLTQWLPAIIPDNYDREKLVQQVHTLDARILHRTRMGGSIDTLLKKRAKLLKPVIGELFAGKAIDEKTHQQVMAEYKELQEYLAPPLQVYVNTLLYLGRVTKAIYTGMPAALGNIVDKATIKDVNLHVDFALTEKDMMIPVTQTQQVKNNLDAQKISAAFEGFSLADTFAHASVGYNPSDILPNIYQQSA